METLDVKCPCCKAVITVNRESGQVLHCEEFKKGPAEFDAFLSKQKNRKDDLQRRFDEAKEKSRNRLQSIAEKIEYAKRRVETEGDTGRPLNPLDRD